MRVKHRTPTSSKACKSVAGNYNNPKAYSLSVIRTVNETEPQASLCDLLFSQIKEEDETKTSRQNSPMQQTRRCQSQILLKSKYKLSTRGNNETPKLPNTPENNNTPKVSDDSETKKRDEEHDGSESDNDTGDEDVDPEEKDKERKISEKRILEIVHCDVGIQEKLDGSNANTPTTAQKTKKGKQMVKFIYPSNVLDKNYR